ncbi:MAG: XRE family transcriptional regulator, partial [Oscillospiraceae bacterium]
MLKNIGDTLCSYRKKSGLSQRQLALELYRRGVKVTNQAVSKWESGASLPNAAQFLVICDILNILDVSGVFFGRSNEVMLGLNAEGRQRVSEFARLLCDSGQYDDPATPAPRGSRLRSLPVYDIDMAVKGQFLDSADYEAVQVGTEVPIAANFGVKISGDSMEPEYHNGQIVWISQATKLEGGEVGLFMYDGKPYFKRLRDRVGGIRLQSIDTNYPDVIVALPEDLKALG